MERKLYESSLSESEKKEETLRIAKMVAAKQGLSQGKLLKEVDWIQNMLHKGCDWSFIKEIPGVSEVEWPLNRANYPFVLVNPWKKTPIRFNWELNRQYRKVG